MSYLGYPDNVPLPERSPETISYWEGADRGELWFRRCTSCAKPHHYPRALCPFCFAADPAWERAAGHGTLYSFSVTGRPEQPYVIAYVKLAEGPIMMTNIVNCDPNTLFIGQSVVLASSPAEGGPPIPMFQPA
ncbi:Zn-ribbon domain-containing OB-fold protein [Paraburkholderia antibiotica]|uniref:DNA-binding protein n=1 Tax=Paraburkholderia antibiotica TaxID=2728839 RepID=A0A7X9X7P8_9BURK|nr:OB-fold domain-containing protein [Paraburkholderia antibiotica]NML32868.1 DNA-binding protein [Paraburkholderia antibiotica]